MGRKAGDTMKYRITAVRIAGAKPSQKDSVLFHEVVVTRTHKIKTVGDVAVTLRKLPEIITQAFQKMFDSQNNEGNKQR